MADSLKTKRWQQRFQNLEQAFTQLKRGLDIPQPNNVEKQGIIQSFEFTFELAWKTMKDYLESQGVSVQFPRDAVKEGFHYQIVSDGEIWMDMLEKRNQMAHTYDEAAAERALKLIRESYEPALREAVAFFKNKVPS